ncbi:hypothetical protein V6N12_023745 [Hibiscus sabdariffa]|uniref:AAA+ ATPase domain-containing protein n=1 Tax=Hibiscus sabdariffa TaxID=183260 RepID=A0ABR2FYK4_9ROSI
MDIASMICTSLTVTCVKSTLTPIKNHIGYVFNHRSKLQLLRERVERLKDAMEAIQHYVDDAQRNGEEILDDVREWLFRAEEMIHEVTHVMVEEAETAENKCFFGLCPNVLSRYKLARIADRQTMAISQFLAQHCRFDRVSYRNVPFPVPAVGGKLEVSQSRREVLNKIMEAFKYDKSVIGVYGMPGVGKTTLVKEFAREAYELKLFDVVVVASITETPDIMRIQDQIGDMLGLLIEERSLIGRARRLWERLMIEKTILVILDDIWKHLDLMEVGIPSGNAHGGCKLLLASTHQDVLSLMDAQETYPVEPLEENEAWHLFKETAGYNVDSPALRPIARAIAKECHGLPLAIVTHARALRNQSLFVWKDTLRQLYRGSSEDALETEDDTYLAIERSYNHLKSEKIKHTLLLCSFLGHHGAIEDLLKYTMGLGLFSDDLTVEESRDRLMSVLANLKDHCLLLNSYTDERFDMHDLVYNATIRIASRYENAFALKSETVLAQWPDEEKMQTCRWISLQYATVTLPGVLACPLLNFFCMVNKDPSLKMPPNIFKETRNLKVLTLTKMHFSSLPSSICLLTDLRTLCLDQCVLGNIAGIGELKNLEILSLLGSDIEALPGEMGQLLKLKLLDLSGCTQLKVIPSDVLSRFSRLEELYLSDSFNQWRTRGLDDDQRSYASLTEFNHLSRLSTLEVHIRDDRIVPKDLYFTELQRYKVLIGDVWDWSGKFEYSRTMKLKLNRSIDLHPGVKNLLKNTEDLYLDELKGIKKVLLELNGEYLKNLHIQNNSEILYIVNAMKRSPEAFPSLESLFLNNLINLEKICIGQLGKGSFGKLRVFKVRCCGRLLNLFSFSMVKGLPQLKEFEVTDCENIMELAFQEGEGEISEIETTREIKFPQLRFLTIQNLPKLISFCSDDKRHSTSQQGKLESTSGTRSRNISLFDEKVMFCKLEYLKLCALNIQILWHDQLPQVSSSLENLTTLVVKGCNNLKYLFLPFMAEVLVKLKTLEISSCKFLEEVIAPTESISKILLPNLVSLSLHGLPELERFCKADYVEFPVLKELCIRNCPLFNVFVPSSVIRSTYTDRPPLFDDQVAFPALEKLIIIGLRYLKSIWHSQCKSNSFYELKYLEVGFCEELKNIFPIKMLERLKTLNELHIYNCDSLEVIVEPEETNAGKSDIVIATRSTVAGTAIKFVFPRVTYLQLYMLPKLRSFYPKVHTTEWPSLQKIQVCGCDKVHIFASEALGFKNSHEEGHLEMSIQQSLFWVDKDTFPCLLELWLEWNAIMERIWQGLQIPADRYFPRLKVVKLIRLRKESTILSCFFKSFSKVPELILSDASFSEIFPGKGFSGKKEDGWIFDQLSKLSLSKLPELTDLWKESSQPQLVLQNLETLKILGCGRLKNLVPSSVSFQSLTTLEVSKCHGFIYLITPSTAKSMGELKMMSITDCRLIEEIIAHEDNGLMDVLVFPKLAYLRLQRLPSLTSFYSGKDNFHLPLLDELVVRECPKMESLHKGELTTVVNLNATIKGIDTKKSRNHLRGLLSSYQSVAGCSDCLLQCHLLKKVLGKRDGKKKETGSVGGLSKPR